MVNLVHFDDVQYGKLKMKITNQLASLDQPNRLTRDLKVEFN